jgi:signal transduction histidine kinase
VLLLPVLVLAGLVASILVDLAAPTTGPGQVLAGGPGAPYAALGAAIAACAATILVTQPGQRVGWALAGLGAFWMVDGLAQSWVRFAVRPADVLPLADLALWVFNRLGAFLPFSVAVLLTIFPSGRFLAGGWGLLSRVSLAAMGLAALAVMVTPTGDRLPDVALPPGLHPDAATLPFGTALVHHVAAVDVAVSVIGVLIAMASVVVRYRRSYGLERDQMRWLLWSVMAMTILIVLALVTEVTMVQGVALFLVVLLPAVAMTIAVVEPDVVSVEDLVLRTVLYGVLSLLLVGIDLIVLALLTSVLGSSLDQRQVVLTVLLLTVVLYGPLRLRIRAVVRRAMLGRRADPYDAVAGLASTLETTDGPADQLAAVTRSVAAAFGVGFVSVEVDRPGGERLVASYGECPDETRTLPITYRGAAVGRLVLPARGVRSRLTRRDEELLGDLVRQAATAARASRMAEELQQGRERMVLAREEERRRIRRDLHDGLGPALSGVVFRIESALLLVDRDPEAARVQLRETSAEVQEVVADVRRLVHDLRPPALDDRGLVGALTQLAEQQPFEATVQSVGFTTLPAAVEVAAYRIAAEALTNAARHASARTATIRLAMADGTLEVEVADDGRGIAPDRQAGVGLVSLRERAEELGGRSEVTCPPEGGTVVRAWLPLRHDATSEKEPVS